MAGVSTRAETHTRMHSQRTHKRAHAQDVVRAVRRMLDAMGPAVVAAETDALNLTRVPRRKEARLDDYTVEVRVCVGV